MNEKKTRAREKGRWIRRNFGTDGIPPPREQRGRILRRAPGGRVFLALLCFFRGRLSGHRQE